MKKNNLIKIILLLIAAAPLLNSCLKDNAHYVDYSGVGVLVELPLAEYSIASPTPNGVDQTLTYSVSAQPKDTLTVAVNVASPKPLPNALNVTLSTTDTTGIAAYNAGNGTTCTVLPGSYYTVIGSLTVTVPANQRLAYAKIVIDAAAIGTINSGNYVLPVRIESASGEPIAQPEKELFYQIITTP